MPAARTLLHKMRTAPAALRRITYGLRTEGSGVWRETAAIGIGVFIGCLPFYGFHLVMCAAVGSLLRLNRLKVYMAANISNPFVAPWLIFAEIQAGAWLRRGSFHALTRSANETTGLWTFAGDLLTGGVALGAALGALAAWGTYATIRHARGDDAFQTLVRGAADRYAGSSITAWEFARGKLRHDPVYRAATCDGLLPPGATLVDIGCGQGLTLAILAETRRQAVAAGWASGSPPPVFQRLVGVDMRPRVTALARAALAGDAEIITGDARELGAMRADAVLLFDVLHMMSGEEQERLIAALTAALEPGGVMIVREADAAAGWRFSAVRFGNRLKALLVGAFHQEFHFRSASDWMTCFAKHGLQAEIRPMGQGTPFGNVLIRLTARPPAMTMLPHEPPA